MTMMQKNLIMVSMYNIGIEGGTRIGMFHGYSLAAISKPTSLQLGCFRRLNAVVPSCPREISRSRWLAREFSSQSRTVPG